jgi:hypothetical protein
MALHHPFVTWAVADLELCRINRSSLESLVTLSSCCRILQERCAPTSSGSRLTPAFNWFTSLSSSYAWKPLFVSLWGPLCEVPLYRNIHPDAALGARRALSGMPPGPTDSAHTTEDDDAGVASSSIRGYAAYTLLGPQAGEQHPGIVNPDAAYFGGGAGEVAADVPDLVEHEVDDDDEEAYDSSEGEAQFEPPHMAAVLHEDGAPPVAAADSFFADLLRDERQLADQDGGDVTEAAAASEEGDHPERVDWKKEVRLIFLLLFLSSLVAFVFAVVFAHSLSLLACLV